MTSTMNSARTRILIILALVLLSVAGAFAYRRMSVTTAPVPTADETTATEASAPDNAKLQASYVYIATESGQLALDLIQANAEVETEDYGDAGQFVTSINGLAGSNEYYWAFYVNNEYAEQGASQTVLQEGDSIRFVYEAVQQVIRIPVEIENAPAEATVEAEVSNVEKE